MENYNYNKEINNIFKLLEDKLISYNNKQQYVISNTKIQNNSIEYLNSYGMLINSILIDFELLSNVLINIKYTILDSINNIDKNTKTEINKFISKEKNKLLLNAKVKKKENIPYPFLFMFLEYKNIPVLDKRKILTKIPNVIRNLYLDQIEIQLNDNRDNKDKININKIKDLFKVKILNSQNPLIFIGIK